MGAPNGSRLFFVHVMKTGGATFRRHIERSLGVEHVYPNPDIDTDLLAANISVDHLLGLPAERVRALHAYTGHFPFAVTQMLPGSFTTATVLRDPVERTISYLKHCRKYQEQHHGMALEAIYDDPWYFPTWIQNHQLKVFAFTPDDHPQVVADVIAIDDARIATARANLESVDFLGLHEHYDEFVREVSAHFGWTAEAPPSWHVSEPEEIAPSFRRRIADDLAADVEFFEFARELHQRRHRARAAG
jgi:hypothetical protein